MGSNPVITSSNLHSIQDGIDSMHVPIDIGRIPRRIETGVPRCTADQYKNWLTLYSIPCLHSILGPDELEICRHFV